MDVSASFPLAYQLQAVYPTLYTLATGFLYLYVVGIIGTIMSVTSEIAIFSYLLDITPDEQKGISFALCNTLNGVSTFFGSLIDGYLASALIVLGFRELTSL